MEETKQRKSIFLSEEDLANGAADSSRGGGEGVDRKIAQQKWPPKKVALVAIVALFVLAVVYMFWTTTSGGKKLNVEQEKLTIAVVERAPFQEFISVTGNVLPRTTIYLDAVEGGRVEEVYVREGAMVAVGEPLLRLSNNDLQLRLLSTDTQRLEQLDRLQNTRFALEQRRLDLRQQLTEMNYQIQRLRRDFERNRELFEKKLISAQQYEQTQDELRYWQGRKDLTLQSFRADSVRQTQQIEQMEQSVARMNANFQVIQQILENLEVRAPVAGHLTLLDAEVGELKSSGTRLGQIDVLDGYKVRAAIDEFYITRVARGQEASGELAGEPYEMTITRVYPEVRDGRFEVDMEFVGATPEGIRRGQTLRFRLELGDPAEAVLVPNGGFYQTTGGNWIYVLNESGDYAERRSIRLGRKNPQHFEVLEGLAPGERVVTSGYDTFGDADRLVF